MSRGRNTHWERRILKHGGEAKEARRRLSPVRLHRRWSRTKVG